MKAFRPANVQATSKHGFSVAFSAIIIGVSARIIVNSLSVWNGCISPISAASTSPTILSG